MGAYLGDVRDGLGAHYVCGYAAAPGELHCNRDATWHAVLLNAAAKSIVAVMESCDEHVAAVKLSADYVHPLQHPCAIPGSRFHWPENVCVMEWDDAEAFAADLAMPVTVGS